MVTNILNSKGHLVAGSPKIGTFVPTCLGGVDDRVRQVQRVARVQVEKLWDHYGAI